MSSDRIALILNGTIVTVIGIATIIDARWVWGLAMMGVFLIFSGVMDFCGFRIMFDQWHHKSATSERTARGDDNH